MQKGGQAMPNVYEIVTNQIIEQLENGVVAWKNAWSRELACNLLSQRPCRGLNVFFLATAGYESRYWLTFNQANKLGGRIKAGSKSRFVTFWNIGEEKLNARTGKIQKPFLLRYYNVFNLAQTEGIDLPRAVFERNKRNEFEAIEAAESLAESMPTPPKFENSHRAWYSPMQDMLDFPPLHPFHPPTHYHRPLFPQP